MPDGLIQWIDDDESVAHIVRRGRPYVASIDDVESRARIPGARVHFDVVKDEGVERAQNVSLRQGTRTNRRQRRFGDLTGAYRPGSKVNSGASDLGIDVATQPQRVAEAWVACRARNDVDAALSLYAPAAVIHIDGETASGRAHVRAHLADHPARDLDVDEVETRTVDDYVAVIWPPQAHFGMAIKAPAKPSFLKMRHGQIIEVWHHVDAIEVFGAEDESGAPASTEVLELVTHGTVSRAELTHLEDRLDRVKSKIAKPVAFTRIKIDASEHPVRRRDVSASATIDIDGGVVRAHVTALTVMEAVDALADRLQSQIHRLIDRTHTRKGGRSAQIEQPQHDRPTEDREIVRHKTYADGDMTVDEALWDLTNLDYDFYLFRELSTGQECLIVETSDGVVLHCSDAANAIAPTELGAVEVDPTTAQTMSLTTAIEHLDIGDQPFVFFRNTRSNAANVLYRRLDGHYGVITPDLVAAE